jgi:hypothetical protein
VRNLGISFSEYPVMKFSTVDLHLTKMEMPGWQYS